MSGAKGHNDDRSEDNSDRSFSSILPADSVGQAQAEVSRIAASETQRLRSERYGDIDVSSDEVRDQLDRVLTQHEVEIKERNDKREEGRKDRLEWVALWQQRLVLIFIVFVLILVIIAGGWASLVHVVGGTNDQLGRSEHVLQMILDAGIAALVGFYAIKRFEK